MGESESRTPRIGLALGAGAARGWAHIGIIKALVERGVEIDIVSGSSIGALVGAAHASGRLDALEEWVRSLTWTDVVQIMDITLAGGGFIQGERLMAFFERHVENVPIENLMLPFGAVATDLENGQEVWFREGLLFDAVRASIAFPGLFTPLRREGSWLVDGGLVNPVPVSLCRAMGADVVIAVNLNGDLVGRRLRKAGGQRAPKKKDEEEPAFPLWDQLTGQLRQSINARLENLPPVLRVLGRQTPGVIDVVMGSINIMQDRITRSRMAGDPPDLLFSPRLGHIRFMEFHRAAEAIEAGERCVARMAVALADLLG